MKKYKFSVKENEKEIFSITTTTLDDLRSWIDSYVIHPITEKIKEDLNAKKEKNYAERMGERMASENQKRFLKELGYEEDTSNMTLEQAKLKINNLLLKQKEETIKK